MDLELLDSTKEILSSITDLTGKSFEFIFKPDLPTIGRVKIARKNMSHHLIYYKSLSSEGIDHLIAHECGHIYRMMAVPEEERKVPASDMRAREVAAIEMESDFLDLARHLPLEKVGDLFTHWFDGIITEVTNIPVDIRIEKWLYNDYPELRKAQEITIEAQIKENIQALSPEIKKFTPSLIYDTANAMNYAFTLSMEALIGKEYTAPLKRQNTLKLGISSLNSSQTPKIRGTGRT